MKMKECERVGDKCVTLQGCVKVMHFLGVELKSFRKISKYFLVLTNFPNFRQFNLKNFKTESIMTILADF